MHFFLALSLSLSTTPIEYSYNLTCLQVHLYCRAIAPVSVYRSGVMYVLCSRPALSHVFSSFQVLTSPSCHDLSSKYEVRGGRPAALTLHHQNPEAAILFPLPISDGPVTQ